MTAAKRQAFVRSALTESNGVRPELLIVHTGNTAVLCSVCLDEQGPRWRRGQGLGWLSAEYRLLPGSTPQRQARELMKLSGRTQEIQRLIGRSLRAAIDLERLGERSLLIDCDVIQADAGTRTAAITGSWLALKHACDQLQQQGLVDQSPLVHQVAAVSVGVVEGQILLDLDYSEDSGQRWISMWCNRRWTLAGNPGNC